MIPPIADLINNGILKIDATFATFKKCPNASLTLTNFSGSTKPARRRWTFFGDFGLPCLTLQLMTRRTPFGHGHQLEYGLQNVSNEEAMVTK
jgi:hypothetical protein